MRKIAFGVVMFGLGALLSGGTRTQAAADDVPPALCKRFREVSQQMLETLKNRDKDGDRDHSRDEAVFLSMSAMSLVFCGK